jgi:hypothetical protein
VDRTRLARGAGAPAISALQGPPRPRASSASGLGNADVPRVDRLHPRQPRRATQERRVTRRRRIGLVDRAAVPMAAGRRCAASPSLGGRGGAGRRVEPSVVDQSPPPAPSRAVSSCRDDGRIGGRCCRAWCRGPGSRAFGGRVGSPGGEQRLGGGRQPLDRVVGLPHGWCIGERHIAGQESAQLKAQRQPAGPLPVEAGHRRTRVRSYTRSRMFTIILASFLVATRLSRAVQGFSAKLGDSLRQDLRLVDGAECEAVGDW